MKKMQINNIEMMLNDFSKNKSNEEINLHISKCLTILKTYWSQSFLKEIKLINTSKMGNETSKEMLIRSMENEIKRIIYSKNYERNHKNKCKMILNHKQ